MIKKVYMEPKMKVEYAQLTQMLCGSLVDVNTSGLGDDESLDYGDDDSKTGDIWNDSY